MQLVATWHGSTPVDHPGTMVDVGGNKVYLQRVGSGSPTIVWEAGAQGPGWLQTAQYLMGRLAETSRARVYDWLALVEVTRGDQDVSHWSQAGHGPAHGSREGRREGSVRDGRWGRTAACS